MKLRLFRTTVIPVIAAFALVACQKAENQNSATAQSKDHL